MMNHGKRKEGPPVEQRLSKHPALLKRKSPALSAIQLYVPNTTALASLQPAARLPLELMTPTYGTTSVRSPKFLNYGTHFGTPSQSFASTDSLGVYSSPDHTVPASARQHSSLTSNIFSQADASAIDPSLTAYSGTSYPLPHDRKSGSLLTTTGQTRLLVKSDAVQHFKLDVIAPERSQDSAAVLPDGWIDRKQPMVDPNSLQTEQPGYSSMTANYHTAQYAPIEDMPSHLTKQVPDFPSVCFLCPQAPIPMHRAVFNTVDDYNVHLWEEHSDLSTWAQKKCIWRGCKTPCSFATAKLCMSSPVSYYS